MSNWEERLSPRTRERLVQIGETNETNETKLVSYLGITPEIFQQAIQQKMREKGLAFSLDIGTCF